MGLFLLALLQAACGSNEGRALCAAIFADDLPTVEALLAQGADPNETVTFQGSLTTPLRIAVTKLSLPNEVRESIAIVLIDSGGDPNLSWSFGGDCEGCTGYTMYAVAIVARGGSLRAAEAFIEAGSDIRTERGAEALIVAAKANNVDMLRVLADAGAPLSYRGQGNDTPLAAAVEARAVEAIAFLEERGASEW